jgi:hypothetical protein
MDTLWVAWQTMQSSKESTVECIPFRRSKMRLDSNDNKRHAVYRSNSIVILATREIGCGMLH